MPKLQKNPMGTELKPSVVQKNFEELFQDSHDHQIRSTFPTDREGVARDIVIVDTGSAVYICVKTLRGWFKSAAMTAV